MTVAVLDSTVVIHIFRKYRPAIAWFNTDTYYAITSVTWMEVMIGAPNKRAQAETLDLLNRFEIAYLTEADQLWAMDKIHELRFTNAVSLTDTLIAAVAQRLQVPLYTHNLRDMAPLIGALAVQPYQ